VKAVQLPTAILNVKELGGQYFKFCLETEQMLNTHGCLKLNTKFISRWNVFEAVFCIVPLSHNSDENEISLYVIICCLFNHSSDENKGNNHQG